MIKETITVKREKGIHYVFENGKKKTFKPWLGEIFSFLYDRIMEKSVFPNLFGGDIEKHIAICKNELHLLQDKKILDVGAGSGVAVSYLPGNNLYTGIDISPGLLKKAETRFQQIRFSKADFYVSKAENLPFQDNFFDVCLCMLTMNFFDDIPKAFSEIKRILSEGGTFFCSVPVPERKTTKKTVHGTLLSEEEIQSLCRNAGFTYTPIKAENGALLYFKAQL